jgi:hypothetical protein
LHLYRADQLAVFVRTQGQPAEYKVGLDLAIDRGWLWLHESGTYVKLPKPVRRCCLTMFSLPLVNETGHPAIPYF